MSVDEPGGCYDEALEAWERGDLDAAADGFRRSIELAPMGSLRLPEAHSALGQVLCALGDLAEARRELELALEITRIVAGRDDRHIAVVVARYFLADHLLRMKSPNEALGVVTPSIGVGSNREALLQVVRAQALAEIGDSAGARSSAIAALQGAMNSEQKARIQQQLAQILDQMP